MNYLFSQLCPLHLESSNNEKYDQSTEHAFNISIKIQPCKMDRKPHCRTYPQTSLDLPRITNTITSYIKYFYYMCKMK